MLSPYGLTDTIGDARHERLDELGDAAALGAKEQGRRRVAISSPVRKRAEPRHSQRQLVERHDGEDMVRHVVAGFERATGDLDRPGRQKHRQIGDKALIPVREK